MKRQAMRSQIPRLVSAALSITALVAVLQAQSSSPKIGYTAYEEARPIVEALRDVLPAELRAASAADLPVIWARWIVRRDAEIRARLVQGDEDSLVNFLLFGTSFTRRPRITLTDLARAGSGNALGSTNTSPDSTRIVAEVQSRADDLIQAMAAPAKNERVLFARRLVESKGL